PRIIPAPPGHAAVRVRLFEAGAYAEMAIAGKNQSCMLVRIESRCMGRLTGGNRAGGGRHHPSTVRGPHRGADRGSFAMSYVFQCGGVFRYGTWLLEGVAVTLAYAITAMALSVVVGTLGALGRRSRYGWLRAAVWTYVEAIRNTPFLVQLFILFF